MKLKTAFNILGAFALLGMFASCSSSNQTTASSFGTRKYTKGYFFNNPGTSTAVAANKSSVMPKASSPKVVTVEKSQSAPVVSSNSPATSVNVASVKSEKTVSQKGLPANLSKKSLRALTAKSETKTISASSGYPVFNVAESASVIDANAQVSSHSSDKGGMFDFKDHPIRTVLIILLVVLIVVILIVALASGNATVTAS